MKSALYVDTVARTYRKAIDDCFASVETYRNHMEWYRSEISKCTHRQYTTGFYFGKPDENTQIYDSSTYINEYKYLGMVEEKKDGLAVIGQKNKFSVGDHIEIMKPDGRNVAVVVEKMYDDEGNEVDSCPHSRQKIRLKLSEEPEVCDLLRTAEV